MKTPEVSIVVPVFNGLCTVSQAFATLQEQTLRDLEIIFVDDASTDGTAEAIKKLQGLDSRVSLVAKTTNGGVHEARVSGLKAASGAWIGFMDADDLIEPDMFSLLIKTVKCEKADIAICGVDRVTTGGKRTGIKKRFRKDLTFHDQILKRFCAQEFGTGSLWNKLYKRELIENHLRPFPWRQDSSEDTIVNVGCFHDANTVATVAPILYHYTENSASATQTKNNAAALVDLLRAYALTVKIYSHLDEVALNHIDSLYRTQLRYTCYHTDNLDLDDDDLYSLQAALAILVQCRTAGMAKALNEISKPSNSEPESYLANWREWKRATTGLLTRLPGVIYRRLK